jgi:hypothetical protein
MMLTRELDGFRPSLFQLFWSHFLFQTFLFLLGPLLFPR